MIGAILVFSTTLTGTLLIPAVRAFFAFAHGGDEVGMHAFMSANMLGAAMGAPFVAAFADRHGRRARLATLLLLIDGGAMSVAAVASPLWLVLAARFVQGAASVGALSIVMGSLRGTGKAMGVASAAVVAAIACGAPFGTLFVKLDPRAALWASAALSFASALLAHKISDGARAPKLPLWTQLGRDSRIELLLVTIFVALERFAVGSFVVTFSLYAHSALGKTDAQVGMLFTSFLLPFALGSLGVGAIVSRGVSRVGLLLGGGLIYGVCVALFGQTDGALLWGVMICAGIASAAIYAPSLSVAASAVPDALRSTAMGLVNAGGTLGMLLGTATAGIVSVQLVKTGMNADEARRLVFVGVGCFVAAAFAAGGLPLLIAARSSNRNRESR
jgi:MFS family permease